uniref:Uncharacterized protein n=1 Tax=Anguilla anguilla TaxID=7936 RepID=A0A0E9Q7T1_ANGAN
MRTCFVYLAAIDT